MADKDILPRLAFMKKRLEEAENNGLYRSVREFSPENGAFFMHEGKRLVNFCSNDYLGLTGNESLKIRALDYMNRFGAGSGASRLVCGDRGYFNGVEKKIAKLKGKEEALVIGSGFQANISVIPSICTRNSLIIMDRLCHSSLVQGAVLSRAEVKRFRHLDLLHLAEILKNTDYKKYDRVLVVTESVFSMDGDVTNISELCSVTRRHDVLLMVDEAHATGILGEKGAGLCLGHDVDIVMGTFSKALGSYGSYIAGSGLLKEYLVNFCTGFIFSTALPPSVMGSVDAAIDLLPDMEDERKKVSFFSERMRKSFSNMGLDCGGSATQIVPVLMGEASEAVKLSAFLFENGVLASAIRPPTVPKGESRIRFTLTAAHSEDDVELVLDIMKRWGRLGV